MIPGLRIRGAEPADVVPMFSMIVELAEYERAREQITGTPELLAEALFGPRRSAEALIAERDRHPAGFALFYSSFSTWECRSGIWLEDLYVPPRERRAGVGQALLSHLASLAVVRGCPRLEWSALDWNALALDFYAKIGAERLPEWQLHRLSGEALRELARGSDVDP